MTMAKSKVLTQEDIASLDEGDFMDQWTALGEQVELGKAQLLLFSREHQRREEQARLGQRLGTLGDAEKAALVQYIESQGADSSAAVGTPNGGK
jgi:hypothetical protein